MKLKDLEMGKNLNVEKPKKEKNIADVTLLAVLKSDLESPQHYFILFKSKYQ